LIPGAFQPSFFRYQNEKRKEPGFIRGIHNYFPGDAFIMFNSPECYSFPRPDFPEETLDGEENCNGCTACSYLFACRIVCAGHRSHRATAPDR
jgi:hypothetical protein